MIRLIRSTSLLWCFVFIHGDVTPWWDVQYRLDIDYPSLGNYRWLPGEDIMIVRGKGVNRRSFYRVDPAIGDTVLYLDSTVFRYKEEYVPVVDWKFSKDGELLLIQSKSKRIWRHSRSGSFFILHINEGKLTPVSKNNDQLRNVKLSPNGKYMRSATPLHSSPTNAAI